MFDPFPQSWLVSVGALLIIAFLFKVLSASRSQLHALPGPERASLLLGNVSEAALFSSSERNYLEEWTDTYGSVVRVHGILGTQPELCVTDPEFLHRVYITNDDSWPKPNMLKYFMCLIFGPGVLSAHGSDHKRQRKMLNPMFTVAHTRALTSGMYDVAHKLTQKLSNMVHSEGAGSAAVDVLKLASATTLDIIGSAGLGHDFEALEGQSLYSQAIKQFSPTVGKIQLIIPLLEPLSYLGPYSFRSWVMDTVLPLLGDFGRSALKVRRILKIMHDNGVEVYRDRQAFIATEAAIEGSTQFSKADVLSNLVRATSKDSSMVLEEPEAVAQINTLVFAGHETTSNAITHALDILSTQQDLQDRLRNEILEAQADAGTTDELSYDVLMGLPILGAVVCEILRLYPPVPSVSRESTADAVVPLSLPVKSADGKTEITEIFVPKRTTIHVSIAGLNRSKAIWGDDAKEFNYERWLRADGPGDATSKAAFARIPGVFPSMMTFAGGPKGCLGWRMAVFEIKLVLATLIQRFRFQHQRGFQSKWMYGATTFPTITGQEAVGPQLPLIVSELIQGHT